MSQAKKQQIVKYQKGKHSFKVVCHPGTVLQYREGKLGINKVLQIDIVFTNVPRGDRASAEDLKEVFGANASENEILSTIVSEGEIEYSASERKKFVDDKTNEIIYHIHKNYIDPKTNLPHPIDRIKMAMKSSNKKLPTIDIYKDSKKQAETIVSKLQGVLLFAKAASFIAQLTIKYTYDGKCKNIIHGCVTKVVKEEYSGDGCVYTIEMTKSEMDNLIAALSKPTSGDYNLTMLDENNVKASNNSSNNNDSNESKSNDKSSNKPYKKKKQSSKHGQIGQQVAAKKDKKHQNANTNSNENQSENKGAPKQNDATSDASSGQSQGKSKGKKNKNKK